MTDDSKKYRRYAEECRRLADQFQSAEDKATLLHLGQTWDQLADQTGEDQPKSDRSRPAARCAKSGRKLL
jgi:hypothetical protein